MSEFKAIETQEELDGIIRDRLARNTQKVTDEVEKRFTGYISPKDFATKTEDLNRKISDYEKAKTDSEDELSRLRSENNAYKVAALRDKAAREAGIPAELAGRITGATEEEMAADAKALAELIGRHTPQKAAPAFEAARTDISDDKYARLLKGFKS